MLFNGLGSYRYQIKTNSSWLVQKLTNKSSKQLQKSTQQSMKLVKSTTEYRSLVSLVTLVGKEWAWRRCLMPTTKGLFGIQTKWNKIGEGNDSEQLKNIIYRWKESLGYPFNFFCHMFSSNMSPEVTRINHFCHTNVSPLVKILCKDNKSKISLNYDQACVILFLCVIFCYNFHQCTVSC